MKFLGSWKVHKSKMLRFHTHGRRMLCRLLFTREQFLSENTHLPTGLLCNKSELRKTSWLMIKTDPVQHAKHVTGSTHSQCKDDPTQIQRRWIPISSFHSEAALNRNTWCVCNRISKNSKARQGKFICMAQGTHTQKAKFKCCAEAHTENCLENIGNTINT